MSDRDTTHLLEELQHARSLADSHERAFRQANARCVELMEEVGKLLDLLRWRDVRDEPLPNEGSFLIVEKNKHYPKGVLLEFHWVWPFVPPSKNTTHWMPMLKLPSEGGE